MANRCFPTLKFSLFFFVTQITLSVSHGDMLVSKQAVTHFDPLWSGSEHKYLGDEAVLQVCRELSLDPCPIARIPRKDKKYYFEYGLLVALGDFYMSAEEIYNDQGKDLTAYELDQIFSCIDEQGKILLKQKEFPHLDLPNCKWVYGLSGNQLKLVRNNYDHFGWNNMRAYVEYHQKAIELAFEAHLARRRGPQDASEDLFAQALIYNGFADHFLTDAFSAGHIRVPRRQLKDWADQNYGIAGKGKGDLLGLMFHDSEGFSWDRNELGLRVGNSRGDQWTTHTDNSLFSGNTEEQFVQLPIRAVAISIREVLSAYYFGNKKVGEFEAIEYVPFSVESSFAQKYLTDFGPTKDVARWLRGVLAFPTNLILTNRNVVKLLEELPQVMERFRADIRADIVHKSELVNRLPRVYVESYQEID